MDPLREIAEEARADPLRQIADAVLYEGYVLWPYRRSALKNTRRFTFGGVYPPAHTEAHPDDPGTMQTQVLLEGGADARLDVRVRFLQVVRRQIERQGARGAEPVDELTVGGERYLSWEEATEREIAAEDLPLADLASPRRVPIAIPAGRVEEELREGGRRAGAVVRAWSGLEGEVTLEAEPVDRDVHRITVKIENRTPFAGGGRDEALAHTFCSTHTVLRAHGGAFVSSTDPPDALRTAVDGCRNVGAWPVLVGEVGERHSVLSSPIILEEYPRVAPESPGDLFDGGEIDQLLTLNILSLTEAEKAEMRATDPRAREILDRTEALSENELRRLHGAVRDLRQVRS
jgi:hypothetical protein